jgi:hypothetical protein
MNADERCLSGNGVPPVRLSLVGATHASPSSRASDFRVSRRDAVTQGEMQQDDSCGMGLGPCGLFPSLNHGGHGDDGGRKTGHQPRVTGHRLAAAKTCERREDRLAIHRSTRLENDHGRRDSRRVGLAPPSSLPQTLPRFHAYPLQRGVPPPLLPSRKDMAIETAVLCTKRIVTRRKKYRAPSTSLPSTIERKQQVITEK